MRWYRKPFVPASGEKDGEQQHDGHRSGEGVHGLHRPPGLHRRRSACVGPDGVSESQQLTHGSSGGAHSAHLKHDVIHPGAEVVAVQVVGVALEDERDPDLVLTGDVAQAGDVC